MLCVVLVISVLSATVNFVTLLPCSVLLTVLFLILKVVKLMPLLTLVHYLRSVRSLCNRVGCLCNGIHGLRSHTNRPRGSRRGSIATECRRASGVA